MPILFSARMAVIGDRMPIREKSSVPSILKPRQPSSRATVPAGTHSVRQTREISSSVRPMK